MSTLLAILLAAIAVFLILLVLIQRGRGGGLAGALGGAGGQSAFGTKAGDLFTRITMVVAAIWILLCMLALKWYGRESAAPELGGRPAQVMPEGGATPGAATTGATPGAATTGAAPAATGAPAAPATGTAPAPTGAAPTGAAPSTTPSEPKTP